jgi:uncharacterized tellurite resistance protein B-like protein
MNNLFSYNQAVFGLMLLGAKADGKLQESEKYLLVELSSEEHHLTSEEYKYIISEAKDLSDEDFAQAVYDTLNSLSEFERIKAAYWLLKLISADKSSDQEEVGNNQSEMKVYEQSLKKLHITSEAVKKYEESRG